MSGIAWAHFGLVWRTVEVIPGPGFVILPTRRDWFAEYCQRIDAGVIRPEATGTAWTCPCCGHPTLDGRGHYEICELCDWEDDGQDDPQADEVWGGPNGKYSLTEAGDNFARYGIMYRPDDRGTTDSADLLAAKNAVLEAFEALRAARDEPPSEVLENLRAARANLREVRSRN